MHRIVRVLSYGGGALAVTSLSIFHGQRIAVPAYTFTGTSRFSWAIAYSLLLGVATYAVGLPDQPRNVRQAAKLALIAVAVAAVGISLPQLILGDALLPRFVVFGAAGLMLPYQVLMNALARIGQSRASDRDRVLLVAQDGEHIRLVESLGMDLEKSATLVGTLTPEQATTAEPGTWPIVETAIAEGASVVVIDRFAQAEDLVIAQAAKLHESGVRVRTLQGFYEEWLGKLPLSELERASLFFDIGELHGTSYGRLKRMMDISFGLLGLIPLALLIPVVWVANLAANRGPLLYRQPRVGKGGETFTILKFRTMRAPSAADTTTAWTSENDPRVTPFGKVLRHTHLDELPQVFNILRGDLSIVGPRPEQPHYVDELSSKLAFYDLRHLVRPGLTGWAQVKYGYAGDERDALEKLQYEFYYLRNQDLAFDNRIIVRTLRAMIGGQGSGR